MARWQPAARERLQAAALERFTEQGFDRTTVAEIAAAAGLTERTFFRYFADKREVLLTGVAVFRVAFAGWIADGEQRSLAELQRAVFAELRALVNTA